MSRDSLAILSSGLMTSVGLSAPAACAAIRAGIANPSETRIADAAGDWLLAHAVPTERSRRGPERLAHLAVEAIKECLAAGDWMNVTLLMCVSERDRPGRPSDLERNLIGQVQELLEIRLSEQSLVISQGRAGVASALLHARKLLGEHATVPVLVAATDSLLSWDALQAYERQGRLLTKSNSNGFIPGEAAAAVLVGHQPREASPLVTGIGVAREAVHVMSEDPLRGEGLAQAIRGALSDAGCQVHDLDARITDLAGEQYHFKEAALALARCLRRRKEQFEIWQPAESVGECGAALGIVMLAVADAALRKGYAPGANLLLHMGTDSGLRAAVIVQGAG